MTHDTFKMLTCSTKFLNDEKGRENLIDNMHQAREGCERGVGRKKSRRIVKNACGGEGGEEGAVQYRAWCCRQ